MSSNTPRSDGSDRDPAKPQRPAGRPSLIPGTALLAVAAALIVVVLVKPNMPHWMRAAIAVLAVLVVVALLVIAFMVFRGSTRPTRRNR